MNESFETKKPVDKYIEGAMRKNEMFLSEVNDADSISTLSQIIRDYAYEDESEEWYIFNIIEKPGDEVDASTITVDDMLGQINAIENNPDLTAQDIIEMVEIGAVAHALNRILEK